MINKKLHQNHDSPKLHQCSQAGYSLLEVLLVIIGLSVIAIIFYAFAVVDTQDAAASELFLGEMKSRLSERRTSAMYLNSIEMPTSLEPYTVPPVSFDFNNSASTARLVTSGVDNNRDGADDYTGRAITSLKIRGSRAIWSYSYEGAELKIPSAWKIAASAADLGSIPALGANSVQTTAVAFDGKGNALGQDGSGVFQKQPETTESHPRWAIYAVRTGAGGGGTATTTQSENATSARAAVAITVYPSGSIEAWRFNGKAWEGFGRRE